MFYKVTSLDRKYTEVVKASAAREAGMQMAVKWQQGVEVERMASEPKLTKARKAYECDCCGDAINKGDLYRSVSRSIGNPSATSITALGIKHHGFRYTQKVCVACVKKNAI